MKVVLLADAWVGEQVARILREQEADVVGLVLHPREKQRNGGAIVDALGIDPANVMESGRLHDDEPFTRLEAWKPDIIVAAWYGHILKKRVLHLPPGGCINLHPSYLPYNRGKFPNVWAIIDGTPAGATIHYMDEGVDTGDVILRSAVPITATDTGETLYGRLQKSCVAMFGEAWPMLMTGTAPRIRQDALPDRATSHRERDVVDVDAIDLDKSYVARDLLNLLRARTFSPHPAAYFVDDGRRVYVRTHLEIADGDLHKRTL